MLTLTAGTPASLMKLPFAAMQAPATQGAVSAATHWVARATQAAVTAPIAAAGEGMPELAAGNQTANCVALVVTSHLVLGTYLSTVAVCIAECARRRGFLQRAAAAGGCKGPSLQAAVQAGVELGLPPGEAVRVATFGALGEFGASLITALALGAIVWLATQLILVGVLSSKGSSCSCVGETPSLLWFSLF